MNTLSLYRLACSDKKIKKSFGDVYASDSLPKHKYRFSSFIVNLDESTLPGTHWIPVYFENKYNRAFYFDSYGKAPSKSKFLTFLKPNASSIYHSNLSFQDFFLHQHVDSSVCTFFLSICETVKT